jgi:L-histidine Nalpha-methyltransferase
MDGDGKFCGYESREQLLAIMDSLAAGTVPSKFAYVGQAADTHNAYASTDEYGHVTKDIIQEARLLLEVWGNDIDGITTLIDFGPGNGLHTVALLRHLSSAANWSPRQYLGVDFSRTLAEMAKRNIVRSMDNVTVRSVTRDLEDISTIVKPMSQDSSRAIHLLLGNTIGNVESPFATLLRIRGLAGDGGRLMIGCSLFDGSRTAESYVEPYHVPAYRMGVLRPLTMLRIPIESIKLIVTFDGDTKTVFTSVQLWQDVSLDLLGRRLVIREGTTLRCFISRRFCPGELPGLLREAGFDVLGAAESLTEGVGTYCVAT